MDTFKHERRNFIVFAVNQILMRFGWTFKAEAVVMPAFLDTYTQSGIIRGLMPLILRTGQSLPQFLIAHRVAQMPRKKRMFLFAAFGIAIPWVALALALGLTSWQSNVIVIIFFVLYTLHWFTFGCNILAFGTLQGKLIRPEKRGRLLAYANIIGCTLSIPLALLIMPHWLGDGKSNYAAIFFATGICFGLAASAGLCFREFASPHPQQSLPFLKSLLNGLLLLRDDRNFRRYSVVILLFYSIWPLFPHYTVFGKRTLGLVSSHLVTSVIAQNIVSALGSGLMGNIADRRGNRLALRLLILINCCIPLLAIGITRIPKGARFYFIVFALLGFTPVSSRIVANYTLEISPQEKHPQYLGVMSLFQAMPLFASPLLGLWIEKFSFEFAFICCCALVFLAFLMTFRLVEPRFITSEK
jgi:MFS family permease